MGRIHLFEIEDQKWCPKLLRDCLTDYLRHFEEKENIYANAIPILKKGLSHSRHDKIVDFCSGAAGPWKNLLTELPTSKVTLTDLYPNRGWLETINKRGNVRLNYSLDSVNALELNQNLSGLKTMFGSFHHFKPSQALNILINAQAQSESIAIFEFTERNLFNLLFYPVLSLLGVLLVTPAIRPFRWLRIIFTYIVPLVPLAAVWDGYVSNLRTYSEEELKSLTAKIKTEEYVWEIGRLKTKNPLIKITYLLGIPVDTTKNIANDNNNVIQKFVSESAM